MEEVRFVVNKECNLRCRFCHREGKFSKGKSMLTEEDMEFIMEICRKHFNFSTCTITGGEPLIKDNIEEIVRKLSRIVKVVLVTNGILLEEKKKILKYLDELHISLFTLDKDKWAKVTRNKEENFEKILRAIEIARKKVKLKINCCFLKGINDDYESFLKLYTFCKNKGLELRLIELLKIFSPNYYTPVCIAKSWVNGNFEIPKRRAGREVKLLKDLSIVNYPCNYCFLFNKKQRKNICLNFLDFHIGYDGSTKICFLKPQKVISILKEVKRRDREKLIKKLEKVIENIGEIKIRFKKDKEYESFKKFMCEKPFRIPTVYCALKWHNKFLFLKRKKPKVWEFPGGKIEIWENLKEAIIREVREEIGVKLNPKKIKLLGVETVKYPNNYVKQVVIMFIYKFKDKPKIELSNNLNGEHSSYKWIVSKKFPKNLALSVKLFEKELIKHGS